MHAPSAATRGMSLQAPRPKVAAAPCPRLPHHAERSVITTATRDAPIGSPAGVVRGSRSRRNRDGTRRRREGSWQEGQNWAKEKTANVDEYEKNYETFQQEGPEAFKEEYSEIPKEKRQPWVQQLYKDAENDEDIARLLEGTGGNPQLIKWNMQKDIEERLEPLLFREGDETVDASEGAEPQKVDDAPSMTVTFAPTVEMNNVWIWIQLQREPDKQGEETIQAVIAAWFSVGRVGGYRASNTQCLEAGAGRLGGLEYRAGDLANAGRMHAMGETERRGRWMRVWVDFGATDELAFDALLNALGGVSEEFVPIASVQIGGRSVDTGDSGLAEDQEPGIWQAHDLYAKQGVHYEGVEYPDMEEGFEPAGGRMDGGPKPDEQSPPPPDPASMATPAEDAAAAAAAEEWGDFSIGRAEESGFLS